MASVEEVRQLVMALDFRLRNSVGRRLVERHAPVLLDWLNAMVGFTPPVVRPVLPEIQIIEAAVVQADPELSRLAYLLDLFPAYRVWLCALRALGNGSGWLNKEDLYVGLKRFQIEIHPRSLDRYIQQGLQIFWTYDKTLRRVYLRSSVKVALALTELLLKSPFAETLSTNKPGAQRVSLTLSGSIRQASANAYAAWFAMKQKTNSKGTMISRDTLMRLWGVSVPTLLEWEALAGISKTANFAQQADTSIENVPQHARLVKGIDGKLFVSWQLPNSYYAPSTLQLHERMGNSRAVRDAVLKVLNDQQPAKYRGWGSSNADLNQGGSLRLGRLYFEADEAKSQKWQKNVDAFTLIARHLKKDHDVFRPHYALLGKKGRVSIFERYDIASDLQLTQLWQRDLKPIQDGEFLLRSRLYQSTLKKSF